MLCAIISTGVKPLTILTVDIALKSRKVTQYQAKHVTLALKWKMGSSFPSVLAPISARGQKAGVVMPERRGTLIVWFRAETRGIIVEAVATGPECVCVETHSSRSIG